MSSAPLNLYVWAADVIDRSGILEKFPQWEKEDQKYRGGRPATLTLRAVLIAWLVVGFEQQPLYVTRVAEILSERLTPEAARLMCVPEDFQGVPWADMVRRVERVMERFFAVTDHKPLSKKGTKDEPGLGRRRKMTREQLEELLQDRRTRAEELEAKRRRMFRFANDLLHTQYECLPPEAQTDAISLSIDATFLAAPSRGISTVKMNNGRPEQKMPLDPDAGWYVRTYEQGSKYNGDAETATSKVGYGYEAELAVLVSNDPNHRESVPHIVVGFNFHTPNASAGENAREIFQDVFEWGKKVGYAIGDMAYFPGANPDVLQKYMTDNGALISMRYPVPEHKVMRGEGTIQAESQGAHMLEGTWMCPMTPKTHREINIEYREKVERDKADKTLTDDERDRRELEYRKVRFEKLEQRNKWELKLKERKDGKEVYGCPGFGKDRTLECPLKPNQPAPREGIVPLPVTAVPKAPGKVCTNQTSVTIDMEVGAKYRQHHRYGSPEWEASHVYGRQTVESYNKSMKRADNSLHDSTNRRMQGETEQAFAAIIAVVAENQRRILNWMQTEFDPEHPATEPRRRASRTDRHTVIKRTRGRGLPAARRARLGLT